ncbi:MAG: 2-C-methyl-D-erythritol 4-phosphate cytidylyltransferase [Firmicutes bacterium HGW-Firmicutes-14]|nr:MAG: 2-C-methyl-D-erythritol 4-phosphate cytidylyltransferase [Firmicutes bacterium HGW-Firmicutes-14]
MDKITAVIPAAGQGRRMKSYLNKQFLLLKGMPIIVHTLRVFQAATVIDEIILVCGEGEDGYYRKEILHNFEINKPTRVLTGGRERQDSVFRGLCGVSGDSGYVMVHDGARPLVTVEMISRLVDEVKQCKAVVAGVPVKDTIKRTDAGGIITETLQRERLWSIQTPQVFARDLLTRAHEQARAVDFYGTDDAALVERMGVPVKVVPGSYDNIKITTPEDILIAETILLRRGNR